MDTATFNLLSFAVALAAIGISCWYCGRMKQLALSIAHQRDDWQDQAIQLAQKNGELMIERNALLHDAKLKEAA